MQRVALGLLKEHRRLPTSPKICLGRRVKITVAFALEPPGPIWAEGEFGIDCGCNYTAIVGLNIDGKSSSCAAPGFLDR